MESLRELYRIGTGPSASHTMGPSAAAAIFRDRSKNASRFKVTLYGSLASTGKGHLTDVAITRAFAPRFVEFVWKPDEIPAYHPNGMDFESFDPAGHALEKWRVYSVGGGALREEGKPAPADVYPLKSMAAIMTWCGQHNAPFWKYVEHCEGPSIWGYLAECWKVMQAAIARGYAAAGTLPGVLNLKRKSASHLAQARQRPDKLQRTGVLTAYALAVSEENASGGKVVTAPTCGACGVMPAVLAYLQETLKADEPAILHAMATAGLVGNLVKTNASISGAAVGCQGEVGTACSMAAGAAAQLMGGTIAQIEYAAEMGFEHHLGLTCDPVAGLVQIPCIERNAVAAMRAVDCAEYAMFSDGSHEIPFDTVVETMRQTGFDLQARYRETSQGGLAALHRARNQANFDALHAASTKANECG
ncbi:MAG: L-serine dehydratase [Planctomycetota bacterium]|nr:L-serine ammonia-lyase [Planctomycetota bacterium]GIK51632.1 MAG: L-serine dehydratase [Planctomycetota bacterium]